MAKKLLVAFCLFLAVCSALQASDLLEMTADIMEIARVSKMEDPRDAMAKEVTELALEFDYRQRVDYYEEHAISLGGATIRSGLLGFGTGLARIGDVKGAMRASIFEGIGFGSVLLGGFALGVDLVFVAPWRSSSSLDDAYEIQQIGMGLVIGGAAVMVLSRVIQMTRTVIWGKSYNRTMRDALGLDKHLNLALVPVPTENPTLFSPVALVASIPL
jgi:hypothetical protein